jgi:osmotically-inducible protein OsmY
VYTSCGKRRLTYCALIGSLTFAMMSFSDQTRAQDLDVAVSSRPASVGAPSTPSVDLADETLRRRVKDALHLDPYFYDEHVIVSVESGAVVLHGFVSSAWDLQDAIRIARKAAGGRRVIDELSIELGGR